jgi:2-dehydropantoate 2-reductase
VDVLVIGAGVIGTVYGANLSDAGHRVAMLRHGPRTDQIAELGLIAVDQTNSTERTLRAPVMLVDDAGGAAYDLVLVAVWATNHDYLDDALRSLRGEPVVLHLGNRLDPTTGRTSPVGTAVWGFPGIGGSLRDGRVEYVRIAQQPTTLSRGGGPRVHAFEAAITAHGFAVGHTDDIAGWLAYHSVFIAAVASALGRCGDDAVALSRDRATLTLMCRAIEEGFAALRARGVGGLPRNLRVLHTPLLRPIAIRYWSRTMRSPMGERCFAAHSRHARTEMNALAHATLTRIEGRSNTDHLRRLLEHRET